MQTNPAVEQNKNVHGKRIHGVNPAGKQKGLWRKGFAKEPSLKETLNE